MASGGTILILLAVGGALFALGAMGAENLVDVAVKIAQAAQHAIQVFLATLGTGPHLWATLGAAFIIAAVVLFVVGGGRGKPKKG